MQAVQVARILLVLVHPVYESLKARVLRQDCDQPGNYVGTYAQLALFARSSSRAQR